MEPWIQKRGNNSFVRLILPYIETLVIEFVLQQNKYLFLFLLNVNK